MKILAKVLLVAALIVGLTGVVMATTDFDTQTVTITFSEISKIAASGDPGTLVIDAPAIPGDLPADESDVSTTMAWTANVAVGKTRKITGSLDGLFSGIDLHATVAAPTGAGGTSAGEKTFIVATTGYDFVTAIGNCNTSAQTITFRASVSSMVAPYTDTEQIVTWTLTEDL
jgi:hypothetical protein